MFYIFVSVQQSTLYPPKYLHHTALNEVLAPVEVIFTFGPHCDCYEGPYTNFFCWHCYACHGNIYATKG